VWVQVPPPPLNLDLSVAGNCVTLPITLPQRQAYASNKGWHGYGSKQICLRAAFKAARTFLSRKHPGLANSFEIAALLLDFRLNRLLAEVGKRGRGKGFGIFPFPFNMSPFSHKSAKSN
jgi:hypothetical protein